MDQEHAREEHCCFRAHTVHSSQMLICLSRMLLKTTDYLDHFARFKRKENVEAVERLLSAHKELAKFERAQLGQYFPPSST